MGDAGTQIPLPETHLPTSQPSLDPSQTQPREVHILVTGFGPFKSFTNNPSYLIASALPQTLTPAIPPPRQKETTNSQSQPQSQGRNYLPSFFNRHLSANPQGQTHQPIPQPLRSPNETPYIIRIHVYPDPVHVSYTPTSVLIPSLLNPTTNGSVFPDVPGGIDFDYVLHIGLASGRDSYTLETIAHRDDYLIPDVDEGIGSLVSDVWRREGVPTSLDVGWDGQDVLRRWTAEVDRRDQETSAKIEETQVPVSTSTPNEIQPLATSKENEEEAARVKNWMSRQGILLHPTPSQSSDTTTTPSTTTNTNFPPVGGGSTLTRRVPLRPRKPVAKLSRDAGRFLCEFILMCSLIYRWKEAQSQSQTPDQASSTRSKLGKVAFLHVPNGTEAVDVERGVLVAESAIRAVIGSWEAGWRNGGVYEVVEGAKGEVAEVEVESGTGIGEGGFEDKGTGDEIPR